MIATTADILKLLSFFNQSYWDTHTDTYSHTQIHTRMHTHMYACTHTHNTPQFFED